jgi:hypothetical protein
MSSQPKVNNLHKQQSSALVRCKQLAKRSAFDLNLAHDAGVSANIPFVHLAKIKRARREVNDLWRTLKSTEGENQRRHNERN